MTKLPPTTTTNTNTNTNTNINVPSPLVLLLSGGLDSYTAGALLKREGFELYALSVRYGQRHVREIGAAAAVARALGDLVRDRGGEVRLSARCLRLVPDTVGWTAVTAAGDFPARFVVTCGGLHADRLVRASGLRPSARTVPFRGEYFKLREGRRHLVRHLIYPVPDPKFPFLGVHFTRLVHGGVEAGPNAVLATAREGYRWSAFNLRDFGEAVLFPGLWKFLTAYPAMSWYEVRRSLSKREFCRSLQRLVPEVRAEDLEAGGAGVRAQAMTADGRLVEDFRFDEAKGILHVVNAPSPAATASLAIGETIARRVLAQWD